MIKNLPARATVVLSGNQDFCPQWLPQVVERLMQLATSNASVKQVVLTVQQQLLQALPEQKALIAAVQKYKR